MAVAFGEPRKQALHLDASAFPEKTARAPRAETGPDLPSACRPGGTSPRREARPAAPAPPVPASTVTIGQSPSPKYRQIRLPRICAWCDGPSTAIVDLSPSRPPAIGSRRETACGHCERRRARRWEACRATPAPVFVPVQVNLPRSFARRVVREAVQFQRRASAHGDRALQHHLQRDHRHVASAAALPSLQVPGLCSGRRNTPRVTSCSQPLAR